MTHILIVGSAPVALEDLRRFCIGTDLLICADGGAEVVAQAGLTPALLVGDMDSISATTQAHFTAHGVQVIEHPREKDQTDMELALNLALHYAPKRITITGALGGRLDHTLGNIMILALPALQEIDVRIVDAGAEALAIWSQRSLRGRIGDYVSLLPLTPLVEGIHTAGLLYALHGEALTQGYTRGVSNELIAEEATIRIESGCLLLIHEW